jgi:dihydrofolate reductase
MRKLIVSTFLTLDGVMQAPGGPGEDDEAGFAHGGWSVNYWDEQMAQAMGEAVSTPFDLLLGRKTYEIMPRTGRTPPTMTAPSRSTTPPSTSRRGAIPR